MYSNKPLILLQTLHPTADDPEPEKYEDNANWLSDIEDRLAEPLREESSKLKSTIRSLLHSRVREEERTIADAERQQQVTMIIILMVPTGKDAFPKYVQLLVTRFPDCEP